MKSNASLNIAEYIALCYLTLLILYLLDKFFNPVKHILSCLFNVRFILRFRIVWLELCKAVNLPRVNFKKIGNLTVLFQFLLQ